MHLTVLLTLLILILDYGRVSFFRFAAPLVSLLHQNCLNWLPQQSQSLPELGALVCGANFSQIETSELYVATGLIHLFVVSGAHLILLHQVIDFPLRFFEKEFCWKDFVRPSICFILLLVYAGICELNPPVTRSLLGLVLANPFFFGKNFWPTHFKVFIAGLLTLLINPLWVTSISLQLSWLIGLAMSLNAEFFRDKHVLIRQSLNYILIFPVLLLFQFPNPYSILMNVIFAPVLEFILFPLALLTGFFPIFVALFDFAIAALKKILLCTEIGLTPQVIENSDRLVMGVWLLIFLIHLFLHFYQIKQERQKSCSVYA